MERLNYKLSFFRNYSKGWRIYSPLPKFINWLHNFVSYVVYSHIVTTIIIVASKFSMSSASVTEAGVGRKKQKASRPQATKKPTVVSREDLLEAEMYQKAKDLQDSTLKALEAIREERISLPKAFLPPARIVQDSPPRAKSSKAKVGESASQVGHDSSSILSTSPLLVVTPTSQFDPSTGEMLYFVEDNSNSGFGEGSGIIPPFPISKDDHS
ncbi:uncharacterized protein LOC108866069 isoform X2 [Pyrus x bretschneideri]|uniref:uncharacterized protein LOC108866069 isoform X2 n=1 Tax=Pyrus x bretschneideri TaxID=225117 RepID=UPI0020302F6D|nr:uncharacterized protein LOC108866069 isoform X2 [Pyrus x bretschneideri]